MLIALAAVALHGSVAGGLGGAFDVAGARAELRLGHVALSAGFGTSAVGLLDSDRPIRNVDHVPALGLRFLSGDGDRLVIGFTWTGHRYERSYDDPPGCFSSSCYDGTARIDAFTVTGGWRFRSSGGFYVEAGIGLGVATRSGHPSVSGHDSIPGPFRRVTFVVPDAIVAVGFEL